MFGKLKRDKNNQSLITICLKNNKINITRTNVCLVINNQVWELLTAEQKKLALSWLIERYCELANATFPIIEMQEKCEDNSLIQSCNYEKNIICVNKSVFEQSENIMEVLFDILSKCVELRNFEKFNSPNNLKTKERFLALPFEIQKQYINTHKLTELSAKLIGAVTQQNLAKETFKVYDVLIQDFKMQNPTLSSHSYGAFKNQKMAEAELEINKCNTLLNFSEQEIEGLKTAVYNNYRNQKEREQKAFEESMEKFFGEK